MARVRSESFSSFLRAPSSSFDGGISEEEVSLAPSENCSALKSGFRSSDSLSAFSSSGSFISSFMFIEAPS